MSAPSIFVLLFALIATMAKPMNSYAQIEITEDGEKKEIVQDEIVQPKNPTVESSQQLQKDSVEKKNGKDDSEKQENGIDVKLDI